MEFVYSTVNPNVPVAYSRMDALHTRCELLFPFMAEVQARHLSTQIWDVVKQAEIRYNRFTRDSLLSEINREASKAPVPLDDEMFLILELCRSFRTATCGYFDVSACSMLRPEARDWILDPEARTVRFTDEGMSLDLGGFIKGFLLENAVRVVAAYTDCALMSFGGSSTTALGNHPLGEAWPVSISHCYFPGKEACTFQLKNKSLSVSGPDPQGKRHIINPLTGELIQKDTYIAVTGPSAIVSEVLSTALWAMPHTIRSEILSRFDGYEATEIACLPDGRSRYIKI